MKNIRFIFSVFILYFFLLSLPLNAAVLTFAGSFEPYLILNERGQIFFRTSEKDVSLSIDDLDNMTPWKLLVSVEVKSPFANDLRCFLRRTSEGFGPGSVSDGWTYRTVGTGGVELFSGRGAVHGLNLQMEIELLSYEFPEGPLDLEFIFRVVTYR